MQRFLCASSSVYSNLKRVGCVGAVVVVTIALISLVIFVCHHGVGRCVSLSVKLTGMCVSNLKTCLSRPRAVLPATLGVAVNKD